MVKLVDTLASGASDRKVVEVQVLSWAPYSAASVENPSLTHLPWFIPARGLIQPALVKNVGAAGVRALLDSRAGVNLCFRIT